MSDSFWSRGGLFSFLFAEKRREQEARAATAPAVALGLGTLAAPASGRLWAISVSGRAHACMFKLLVHDTGAELAVTLEALDLATLAGPGQRDMENLRTLSHACPWRETGQVPAERAGELRAALARLRLDGLAMLPDSQVVDDWHLGGLIWDAGAPAARTFEAMAPTSGPAFELLGVLHRAGGMALSAWRSLGVLDLAMLYHPSLGRPVHDFGGTPRHVRVLCPDHRRLPEVLAALDRLPEGAPLLLDLAPLNHEAKALSRWALRRPNVALVLASGRALSELPAEALPRIYGSVDDALADLSRSGGG